MDSNILFFGVPTDHFSSLYFSKRMSRDCHQSFSKETNQKKSPPNATGAYIRISLIGRKFAAFPFFIFCLQKNNCEKILQNKQIMQSESNLSKMEEAGPISPRWLDIFDSCVHPFHLYLDALLPNHRKPWKGNHIIK